MSRPTPLTVIHDDDESSVIDSGNHLELRVTSNSPYDTFMPNLLSASPSVVGEVNNASDARATRNEMSDPMMNDQTSALGSHAIAFKSIHDQLPTTEALETLQSLTRKDSANVLTTTLPESSETSSSSQTFSSKPWSHSYKTLINSQHSKGVPSLAMAMGHIGEKQTLSHAQCYVSESEDDDELHDPKLTRKRLDDTGTILTIRGCLNIGTLVLLASALLLLFAGYPIMTSVLHLTEGNKGGFGLGGSNATGQVPMLQGFPQLIDKDTPIDAYERPSFDGSGKKMRLVFSDEFNTDGRSFYPGDDPFWEAADLHYWGTGNYEWYDPAGVTTQGGNLVFTLSETPNHNLNFRGAMITTWNKFCFTGGYIEVRVVLPGTHDVSGLWPAAWTMGNLGRAGYGATNDGMWPYTYDECDVGTLPNQTWPENMGGGPVAAETTGRFVEQYGPGLSYLPGQRLSRCTCPAYEDHPGPKHPDGSFKGRSAPEIDILEAAASNHRGSSGHVSMSLQMAPYDPGYNLTTAPGAYEFFDPDLAELNSYTGAPYQQAASGIIKTQDSAYELTDMAFDTYGFEYKEGGDPDSYILWTRSGQPMWRLNSLALAPNPATEVGQRSVPYEPMYIILNLGLSSSFSYVNFDLLTFPTRYYVDYVRVWQPEDRQNVGCDPPEAPTAAYIKRHWEAYNNPNLTIWGGGKAEGGYGGSKPPNRLLNQC